MMVFPANLSALLEHFLETPGMSTEPERLVREAAQGHVAIVRDIINKCPDRVSIHVFVMLW